MTDNKAVSIAVPIVVVLLVLGVLAVLMIVLLVYHRLQKVRIIIMACMYFIILFLPPGHNRSQPNLLQTRILLIHSF